MYSNAISAEENKHPGLNAEDDVEACFIDEGLTDVSGLGELSGVQVLNLHCNRLESLVGLPKLLSIYELNLSSNLFSDSDIKGLTNLPNLRILDISGNNIRSLIGLPYMPFLETFRAAFNNIDRVDGLDGFPALVEIDLRGNKLSAVHSFSGLETLSNLKELTLASSDGRNANPVCSQSRSILQIFDTYCFFGTINEKTREDWADPNFTKVKKASTAESRAPPRMSEIAHITPKFDAVVKKFLSRGGGGGRGATSDCDEGERGRQGEDDISDVTSADFEVSHQQKSANRAHASDRQQKVYPDRERNYVNPWDIPMAMASPTRRRLHGGPKSGPSPTKKQNPSPSRLSTAGVERERGGIRNPEYDDAPPMLDILDSVGDDKGSNTDQQNAISKESFKRPASVLDAGTQVNESLEVTTTKELELSKEVKVLGKRLNATIFAESIGHACVLYEHRHDSIRLFFDKWKANTLCSNLVELKGQLLQENQLLRLTSERASKSAEASRSAVEGDLSHLKRSLAEEKVRSESLKKQLVKQEALSQSQRKELVQAKAMYNDLEEVTAKELAEAKRSAELTLSSAANKHDIQVADLQRKLQIATDENEENKSLCDALQSQVKSLCDQVKNEQSKECQECSQWKTSLHAKEKQLEEAMSSCRRVEQEAANAASLSKEIASLQAELNVLQTSDIQKTQLLHDLKAKHSDMSRVYGDAVGDKKKLEKQLNKVAAGYASLRAENGRLKDDYDILHEDNESNKKAVTELRSISQELKNVLRKMTERCRSLENRSVSGDPEKQSGLHDQLQAALEQVDLLRKERENIEKVLSENETRHSEELHEVMETQRDLELNIRVKEKMIDDLNATIRRMKDKHREDEERMQQGMRHLEDAVEELKDDISELERQLEVSKEEEQTAVFELQEMKASQQQEKEEMQDAADREIEQLKSRLSSRDKDLESVQAELTGIGSILKEYRQSSGQKDEQIQSLIQELASLRQKYESCDDDLQQEKQRRLELFGEVKEMRSHIAMVVEREKVIMELKKALKMTKLQLEDSNKKCQKMAGVLHSFQDLANQASWSPRDSQSLRKSLECLEDSFALLPNQQAEGGDLNSGGGSGSKTLYLPTGAR